jgi:hypothetical protein
VSAPEDAAASFLVLRRPIAGAAFASFGRRRRETIDRVRSSFIATQSCPGPMAPVEMSKRLGDEVAAVRAALAHSGVASLEVDLVLRSGARLVIRNIETIHRVRQ